MSNWHGFSSYRYLQEVGYTDTILDVKSKRVRTLLGLSADGLGVENERNQESMVNGTETETKEKVMIGQVLLAMCSKLCF